MIPMAELAEHPMYIDKGYCYLHERDSYSEAVKQRQSAILEQVLSGETLTPER
jgi:hypothetical protein